MGAIEQTNLSSDELGGYLLEEPAPPHNRFDIGLALAGAISAGAYTAGVLDFLIEALDAWEQAKADARQQFGDDTSTWPVPGHDVRLRIMSGASAGAITAAIAAVALRYKFSHRYAGTDGDGNPFFTAWVKRIDIRHLLTTHDLQDKKAPLRSLRPRRGPQERHYPFDS